MRLQAALQAQLDVSPSPEGQQPVIFLLDADRGFDRNLLTRWINAHPDPDREHVIVCLDLRDDRNPLAVEELIDALQRHPQACVAPLRLSWLQTDHAKKSGPRLRDVLRGGERRPPSWLCDQVARLNPERVHLTVGEPGATLDLADRFLAKTGLSAEVQREEFAVFIARQAAVVLDIAERQLIGGRYKVPRYVHQSIRSNRAFKSGLRTIANEAQRSSKEVRSEANEYLREMISIPTRFWLDVWAKLCEVCLGLGYDKTLQYDPADLERIRKIVRQYPSALLWTHKTYIDGFVVPKILFDNNFPMPHFFGGANLNIPILGFFLRRAGAIFIRRSFQDNEVYKLSLKQYIGYLMEKRFPMTWSFEGTRSRLGKLMPPKYGLLKYVLEGAHHADSRDIHIIPVSVSYDLVRDAEEYAREQSGTPKAPESVGWLVRYIKSLARPMGRIHVDFGEPVRLDSAPDPDDQLAISKIAFQVAVEANRVTPATFPAAVSTALLGAFPRALTEPEIVREVSTMTQWATSRGIRLSPDFNLNFADDMAGLLANMIKEGIITRFEGGPETVYGIAEGQAPIASFYRNTVVHFFLTRAVAELALLAVSEQRQTVATLDHFWAEVRELRDLFKFEFFYPDTQEFEQQIDAELCRDEPRWQSLLSERADNARLIINRLSPKLGHAALTIFAEAYSVGTDILLRQPHNEPLDETAFIDRCMSYGRQAYLQRRISSEASIGKLLYANAWKMLSSRGLIDQPEGRSKQAEALNQLIRRLEVIRALSIADRGASTLRDVARETL
ncbi:MAG: 1-acyl-sn-glycerol-3-phosphate acyltransferase [Luminiphilus sp.]|nr:1-acyl-sn-glycerol-3-phosphate acyltransferase [Luminiphilus sp.]